VPATREFGRQLATGELDREPPAELDSSRGVVGQCCCKENRRSVQTAGRKVALTNSKEKVMAKVIRCGFLGRGESVEEAATVIEAHMRSDHPELVGKVTREDLTAMAEET
jgi:predicted small metal-binding protein